MNYLKLGWQRYRMYLVRTLVLIFFLKLSLSMALAATGFPSYPMVLAHRGASGELPEHTLEAYRAAIDAGADFIEVDLVVTKDGYLVDRHDVEIAETTDAQEKFSEFRRTKIIDGVEHEGIFIDDLTLAQVKTLRAKQRVSTRDQSLNGLFVVPTLDEVLKFVADERTRVGRVIGVYLELKHPTYFSSQSLDLVGSLLSILKTHHLDQADSPVILQCFEPTILQFLASKTPVRKMLLLRKSPPRPWDLTVKGDTRTYVDLMSPEGLSEIASYAEAIGPSKDFVIESVNNASRTGGTSFRVTDLVTKAHHAGLEVHPFTFKVEDIPDYYHGRLENEIQHMFSIGVDAVFSDFPTQAVRAKRQFLKEHPWGLPERVSETARDLLVQVFDIDDTLLQTQTKLYLYHKKTGAELAVSTADFAMFGQSGFFDDYQLREPLERYSYREVFDRAGFNQFLEQVKEVYRPGRFDRSWQGPAWQELLTQQQQNPEAVYLLTARHNSPDQIYLGMRYLFDQRELPAVIKKNHIFAIGHPEARTHGLPIPEAKLYELKQLAQTLQEKAKRLGKVARFIFTDDKYVTIEHAIAYFSSELHRYPNVEFVFKYVGYKTPEIPFHSVSLRSGYEPRRLLIKPSPVPSKRGSRELVFPEIINSPNRCQQVLNF